MRNEIYAHSKFTANELPGNPGGPMTPGSPLGP